jgi:hypothetical protein
LSESVVSKRFHGVYEALGIPEREGDLRFTGQLGLTLAVPVPHLVRHPFPPGCGQFLGQWNPSAVSGQHSFGRVTAGRGTLHLWKLAATTGNSLILTSRSSLLSEASTSTVSPAQLPAAGNQLSSAFAQGAITVATFATLVANTRFPLEFGLGFAEMFDAGPGLVIPPGDTLYLIHSTTNTAWSVGFLAWESCGP